MFFQELIFNKHLNEGEKVLYAGHKHWIEIFPKVFKLAFFGLLFPWFLFLTTGTSAFFWIAIIATILVYIRLMYVVMDWYFDTILVSSESLLFLTWYGFFHQESTRISYHSIESINVETHGFFSTVLGFGTLAIEREGADEIKMENLLNPKRLELEILRGKEEFEEKNTGENTAALQNILSQLIAEHIKKHGWK